MTGNGDSLRMFLNVAVTVLLTVLVTLMWQTRSAVEDTDDAVHAQAIFIARMEADVRGLREEADRLRARVMDLERRAGIR